MVKGLNGSLDVNQSADHIGYLYFTWDFKEDIAPRGLPGSIYVSFKNAKKLINKIQDAIETGEKWIIK